MKTLLMAFVLIWGSFLYAQETGIETVRRLFLEAGRDSCKARDLFRLLEKEEDKPPLLLAYEGVAESMLAQCTKRNVGKMKVFISGKRKLESAVEKDPQNWEIRFLRFQLQTRIPAFLGYKDFNSDKPFLLSSLQQVVKTERDRYFVSKVIEILMLSGEFNREEISLLRRMKTELNSVNPENKQ